MKYFTKEWHELSEFLGTAEMFEPIIDKEYTEEEFGYLYEDLRDKFIQEMRDEYENEPEMGIRLPFDEEEAGASFDEDYQDNLEEPDEDVPEWIRESVDPRFIALWVLPEKTYIKLMAEEKEKEERFDELDAAADDALDAMYDEAPEDMETLLDDFDDLDGDSVTDCRMTDGDLELVLAGWDDNGDDVNHVILFEDAVIIEDEHLDIQTEVDEDGDIISNCDLLYHEVYFEGDEIEVHMLFDNEPLKYLTLRCSYMTITEERK